MSDVLGIAAIEATGGAGQFRSFAQFAKPATADIGGRSITASTSNSSAPGAHRRLACQFAKPAKNDRY